MFVFSEMFTEYAMVHFKFKLVISLYLRYSGYGGLKKFQCDFKMVLSPVFIGGCAVELHKNNFPLFLMSRWAGSPYAA